MNRMEGQPWSQCCQYSYRFVGNCYYDILHSHQEWMSHYSTFFKTGIVFICGVRGDGIWPFKQVRSCMSFCFNLHLHKDKLCVWALLICLHAIYKYSLIWCLFRTFAHFLTICLFAFILLTFKSSSYLG